jgi:putative hydrolase of the HAD superfamily
MAVKLVVFDVDDTLYLERDYVRSGFMSVADLLSQEFGIWDFQEEAWAAFLRGQRGDIFDTALRTLTGEASRSLVELCVDVYRTHRPDIALLSDASSFLTWCRPRFGTAVVTDGPRSSQRAKVLALGLESRIDRIVVTDEMGAGWAKPSVKSFKLLEQEFGYSGSECVYMGDNPVKDFVGPVELGWSTVRVRRRNGIHEDVRSERDAPYVIAGMGDEALVSLKTIFGQTPEPRCALAQSSTDRGTTL